MTEGGFDDGRFWPAVRRGAAAGSSKGLNAGLYRAISFVIPFVTIGLSTILLLWLTHVVLGVSLREALPAILAAGGGGGVAAGMLRHMLRSASTQRNPELDTAEDGGKPKTG